MRLSASLITTALLALAIAAPALAQQSAPAPAPAPAPRTLTLTGQGEVTSAPDIAIISAGVVTEAKTAREALSASNAAMATVLQTIRAAGVEARDIQTSNFSVQPKYSYSKTSGNEQKAPQIDGYTVSSTVTTIVRNLDGLGPVLDAMVSSGANQLNGLGFSIARPEPLRNEARRLAVAEAIARAQLYAGAAGVTLGDILSISEAGYARPPQPVFANARAMAADAAVPVAEGEQTISAEVNIVWEIR